MWLFWLIFNHCILSSLSTLILIRSPKIVLIENFRLKVQKVFWNTNQKKFWEGKVFEVYSWFVPYFWMVCPGCYFKKQLSKLMLGFHKEGFLKSCTKYTYVSHFKNLNASGAGIWVMNTILVLLVEWYDTQDGVDLRTKMVFNYCRFSGCAHNLTIIMYYVV